MAKLHRYLPYRWRDWARMGGDTGREAIFWAGGECCAFCNVAISVFFCKMGSRNYESELPTGERVALTTWATPYAPCAKLRNPFRGKPDFVLGDDASTQCSHCELPDVLFKTQEEENLSIVEFVSADVAPRCLLGCFRKPNQIYGIELFAVLAAISKLKEALSGKAAAVYCDNEAAAKALAKGDLCAEGRGE